MNLPGGHTGPRMNTTTTTFSTLALNAADARSEAKDTVAPEPHALKGVPVGDLVVAAIAYRLSLEEGGMDQDIVDPEWYKQATIPKFDGRCECCGSRRLQYNCVVVHKPTKRGYHVGRDCVGNILGLQSQKLDQITVALAQRVQARRQRAAWVAAHPQHAEIIAWATASSHHIARDIAGKLGRYGSISEPQVALLHRLRQQEAEKAAAKAAEPVPTTPAPEGRVEVEGVVIGQKVVETNFGSTAKWLIRLTTPGYAANKVWVSAFGGGCERGDTVRFRATFTRSDRDPHFAFGSRPKAL